MTTPSTIGPGRMGYRPAGRGLPAAQRVPAGGALRLAEGAGEPLDVGGIPGEIIMDPRWYPGAPLGVREVLRPGQLVQAHTHADVAQWSLVTEGTLVFLVGDTEYEAGPGEICWREPRVPHAVWNPSEKDPATQWEITCGGDMLTYYLRRTELIAAEANPQEILALARNYGLAFNPDMTAKIEAAHPGVSVTGPWR